MPEIPGDPLPVVEQLDALVLPACFSQFENERRLSRECCDLALQHVVAVTADNVLGYVLAFIAAAFAAMNVVGGYVVTGRMLAMFRSRDKSRDNAGGIR